QGRSSIRGWRRDAANSARDARAPGTQRRDPESLPPRPAPALPIRPGDGGGPGAVATGTIGEAQTDDPTAAGSRDEAQLGCRTGRSDDGRRLPFPPGRQPTEI